MFAVQLYVGGGTWEELRRYNDWHIAAMVADHHAATTYRDVRVYRIR